MYITPWLRSFRTRLQRISRRRTRNDKRRSHQTPLRPVAELLEDRTLLSHSIVIPLDEVLDQFGFQPVTIQGLDDPNTVEVENWTAFSIFDTGASVVTLSATDNAVFSFFGGAEVPIKNVGGAVAEGIGGVLTGDVSQPLIVRVDGLNAVDFSLDQDGFPVFEINFDDNSALIDGIQVFVGTLDGSEHLPTISGTPVLNPTTFSAGGINGLAVRIEPQGGVLDFSDVFPGLFIPVPGVSFVAPNTPLTASEQVSAVSLIDTSSVTPTTTQFAGGPELLNFDDIYVGFSLRFATGALAGESRPITDYDGATRTFTFGAGDPFASAPQAGDAFELVRFSTDPYHIALDFVGGDNHLDPGDDITFSQNPVHNHVTLRHGGVELTDQNFLFDTGAMLSTITVDQAIALGLDLNNPQDTVAIGGAGGIVSDIGGYLIDQFVVPTIDGGTITFTDVWVFVVDVSDAIDGILGMNLFNSAAAFQYDPFNSGGAQLSVTFFTDRADVPVTLDPETEALVDLLGPAFAGALGLSAPQLPSFDLSMPPPPVYVDPSWSGTTPGQDPDGDGPATSFGEDAFASLQDAIDFAASGTTIFLAPGTYGGVTVDGKDLTFDGGGGGAIIEGASPALTVMDGQVLVEDGVTLTTNTDDPTVLVQSGGQLTVRNSTIHESTGGFDRPAFRVDAGGLLDLGATGDLGNNIININGAGSLIDNADNDPILAIGNTFQQDGMAISSNFTLEDEIEHALDAVGLGLVTYVANNVYVTANSGSIQRGVDAAAAGDTVNVGAGVYIEPVKINKSLTLSGGTGVATDVVIDWNNTAFVVEILAPAADVVIENIRVTNTATGVGVAGVRANVAGLNLTLDNVQVDDHGDHGVHIENAGDVVVTDAVVTSNRNHGLLVQTANSLTVSGGSFTNNNAVGSVGDGVHAETIATSVMLLNSVMATGNVRGVFVNGAASYIGDETTATGNTSHGALFAAIAGTIDIDGGSYSSNGGDGMFVNNSPTATLDVSNATINSNTGQAIDADNLTSVLLNSTTLNTNTGGALDVTNAGTLSLTSVTATGSGGSIDGVATVNLTATSGPDALTIDAASFGGGGVAAIGYANVTAFNFDGAGDADALNVDFSLGNPVPSGGISFEGGAGSDSLVLTGGATTGVTHTFTNASDGSLTLAGALAGTITYTGLEPITDNLSAADRVFTFNGGSETITLVDAAGANMTIDSTLGESVTFANPTSSLTISAGTGSDTITITSVDTDGPFDASLIINGGTGDDTVNLNADITFAAGKFLDVNLQDDDASPGVDVINVGTNANLVLSGAGSATLKTSRNITMAAGSSIEAVDGEVALEANQQSTATSGNFSGISLSGATLFAAGGGNITLDGRGGATGNDNRGVQLLDNSTITGGTTGAVEVTGRGGPVSGGSNNFGVLVLNADISSGGAAVLVEGTGGGVANTNGIQNWGVSIGSNAFGSTTITSGGTGGTTIKGFGGNTNGSTNVGVWIGNALITSSAGAVLLEGTGGGAFNSADNYGVLVDAGTVTSGGAAGTTVRGFGGNAAGSGNNNIGVRVAGSGAQVTSGGGDIHVLGAAGSGLSSVGIRVDLNGQIVGTTGTAVMLTADSMELLSTDAVDARANLVTIVPRTAGTLIDLGGPDVLSGSPLTLGLTDAELDRITAGTIVIGDAASGNLTVSGTITRPASTHVELHSGGGIVFDPGSVDTAGGNLLLAPGAGGVQPKTTGADATAGTVSFASDLVVVIDGTAVDAEHTQLNVTGAVDLTGVDLVVSGAHIPAAGESFTIVFATSVTGEFNGLNDGDTVTLNSVALQIDYSATAVTLSNLVPDPAPVGNVIAVSRFDDVTNPNDGLWSLREAVLYANANAGDFDIELQTGTYYLTLGGGGEDAAATGDLDVLNNGTITILGSEAGASIINAGGDGGAIPALGDRVFDVQSGATLTLERLNITGGSTLSSGAGIRAGNGATVDILSSAIYGNQSTNSIGGAIAVGDFSSLTLRNSTLSGNTAPAASAIQINVTATAEIHHSTITNNHSSSAFFGHNPAIRNLGVLTIGNTILAGNTGVDSSGYDGYNGGTVNSQGYNLIGNNQDFSFTPATGDQVGTSGSPTDPMLEGLADNGGLTLTHALIDGSPAISAGNPAFTPPPDFDQRGTGFDRVVGGRVDIGAFEVQTVAGTSVGIDAGDLVIEDVDPLGKNDAITIRFDSGNVIIHDPSNALTAGPGATQVDPNTISVPLASISGQIVINGGDGDDTLTIDFSDGSPIPAGGIAFHGGGQTVGDSLVITGNAVPFGTAIYRFENANDGSIDLDGSTIAYTGLEPITGGTSDDLILEFQSATAETITLSDDGDLGDGESFVDSTAGESLTFPNPTNSLTIRTSVGGGAGMDTIDIEGLDSLYSANLIIDADGDDAVNFQTNPTNLGAGTFTVTSGAITVDAALTAGNNKIINLTGSTGDVALNANITASGVSAVTNVTATLGNITDNGAGSISTNSVALTAAGAIGATGLPVRTTTGNIAAQSTSAGDIFLQDLSALDVGTVSSIVGVSTTDGDISITSAGNMKVVGAVNARSDGSVTLVSTGGNIQVNGNILSTQAATGAAGDGSGVITLQAGTVITTTGAGTVRATAGEAALTAVSGIGTVANPLQVEAVTLAADVIGTGDIALDNVGASAVTIGSVDGGALTDLTASGTITLGGGTFVIGSGFNATATTVNVDAGALEVDGDVNGDVPVASGATLAGGGTVSGAVSVAGGGNLSPGNSTDILTTGDLTLVSGATFTVEINGLTPGTDHDQLAVTGAVDLGGATLITSGTISGTVLGDTIVLIDNDDDDDAVTGTFVDTLSMTLNNGDIVTVNGEDFKIFYNGGDGNDVVLVRIGAPTVVYVDDDWSGVTPGTDPDGAGGPSFFQIDSFATIQEAVDAVTDGGTVIVRAGTYFENVVIFAKTVTLEGAQAGVDARGRVTGTPDGSVESIIVGSGGTNIGIDLNGTTPGVVIDGFVFTGGVNAIESNTGTLDNLQVLNSHFEGFTGAGIFLDDSGEDVTVHQNVVDGSSSAGGGIIHLDLSDTFDGFHLTSNWVLNAASGTGFFVDGNHNVGISSTFRSPLFQDNLFDGNATGANLGKFAVEFATISLNTFSNNTFDGLQGGIQNSLIAQNTFTGNGRAGLRLTGFGGTGDSTRGAQNTAVFNNLFSANGAGMDAGGHGDVRLDDQFDGTQSTNTFFNNSFGSTVAVFNNETSGEDVNFSGNWWGTNSEAGLIAKLLGAGAGDIDFTPFLDSGVDTILVAPGFQGDFTTLHTSAMGAQTGLTGRIQEGIDLVNPLGTVIAETGTYTGDVDVNKAVTLVGEPTISGMLTASASGAELSPGFSPGVIASGDLDLGSGSLTTIELVDATGPGLGHDQLDVLGTVTIDPAAQLSLSLSHVPFPGTEFVIIDNDLADPVNGEFSGFADDSTFLLTDAVSGVMFPFTIDYQGGDGNDVVLIVVAPAVVYVDDDWAGTTPGDDPDPFDAVPMVFGYDAFATLPEGTDAVAADGTVIVYAGAYTLAAGLDLDKSLTLEGPNAGISPTNGGPLRVAEAVIDGGNIGGFDGGGFVINLLTGITELAVEGFTFTNFDGNLFASSLVPVTDVALRQNIFDGNNGGLFYKFDTSVATVFDVSDNLISNHSMTVSNTALFFLGNVADSTFDNNEASTVAGRELFNIYHAIGNSTFNNNMLDGTGGLVGLYADATGIQINGNEITNSTSNALPGALPSAIFLATFDGHAVSGVEIDGNVIETVTNGSGVYVQTNTLNVSSITDVQITNNTIESTLYGVAVDTFVDGSGTISDVTISGNDLINNSFSPVLVYSRTNPSFGLNSVSDVTIDDNTFSVDASIYGASFFLIDLRNVEGTNSFSGNTVTFSGVLPGVTDAIRGVTIRGSRTGTWNIAGNTLDGGGVTHNNAPTVFVSGIAILTEDSSTGTLPSGAVINVTNNFINGFEDGIVVRDGIAPTAYGNVPVGVTVNVFENDLSGNSLFAIRSGAGGEVLNASGNWWGSSVEATVAAGIAGAVDFTPFLDSGADVGGDPSDGFQGDFSTLHVTALGDQVGPTGRIQEAVDLVTGSEVIVEAGTYSENVVADVTNLLLRGATGDPADVVIQPGNAAGSGIEVTADNVTLQDLSVTGFASAIEADSLTTLTLTNLLATGNTSGGSITSVAQVNFTASGDANDITITGATLEVTGEFDEIGYSGVATLVINGGDGDDTFHVTPPTTAQATAITVNGDGPTAPASPGDTLNFNVPAGETVELFPAFITTTNHEDVFYNGIETLNIGGGHVVVNGDDGLDDVLEITATAADSGSYVLTTDGVPGPTIGFSGIESLTFHGHAGNDTLIVNNPLAGVFGPTGGVFYHGGEDADELVFNGGTANLVTYTFTNANDGTISFDDGVLHPYTYTGLEPIEENVDAAGRAFNFGGANDMIVLADGTAGRSVISSNNSETVDFLNPTLSLTVSAGAGDDTIDATGSSLSLILFGGTGNDLLRGGAGDDLMVGNADNDTLDGGLGNDTLLGGAGPDSLVGGAGNDKLQGQGHSLDTLSGGVGDDTLDGGVGTADMLIEEADVHFTLTNSTLSGLGTDQLAGIERVILTGGSSGNLLDASAYTAGPVTLVGLGGDDTLLGSLQVDSLFGGDGNDSLAGGLANDRLSGGDGNDTVVWTDGDGSDTLDGDSGTDDVLRVTTSSSSDDLHVTPAGARFTVARVNVALFILDAGGVETLEIDSGDGDDQFTVQLGGGLPGTVNIDAGLPNASDSATILGTAGDDAITVGGSAVDDGTSTVNLANVEHLTIDVSQAAAVQDEVIVNQAVALTGASPTLTVIGGGAGNDVLVVNTPAGILNQVVAIDAAAVAVASEISVGHSGIDVLEVNTGDGDDQISVQLGGGLPAAVNIDAGLPNASDSVTVLGTAGDDTISVGGSIVSDGGSTITLANIENLVIDVSQSATVKDRVDVNLSVTLSGGDPSLNVIGGGAGLNVLVVNAPAGPLAQTIGVDADSVDVTGEISVAYSGIDRVTVNGGDGDDTFNVTPPTVVQGIVFTINGDSPSAPASPGDSLNYASPGGEMVEVLSDRITATNHENVFYNSIETMNIFGGDLVVAGDDGLNDVLELTAAAADAGSYVLTTGGVAGPAVNFSGIDSFTFNARAGNDSLVINNPLAGVFGPAGGVLYDAGLGVDDLVLNGGTASSVMYNFTNSGDGTIVLDDGTLHTITYMDLSPIEDNVAAADRLFNFGSASDLIVLVDGSAGRSVLSSNNSGTVDFVNPAASLTINAGGGHDEVNAAGSSVGLLVNGDAGNDTLIGGGGNDVLNGLGDDDSLSGGAGHDTLFGGSGRDVLIGGAGNDVLQGHGGADTLTGGLGDDTLNGSVGVDLVVETANVHFTLTNAQLTGLGSDSLFDIERVVLIGGAGANSFDASAFTAGPVTLQGLGGDDTLVGGSQGDLLQGGDGNDSLVGGPGGDAISGGNGNDLVVWNNGDGSDNIEGDGGGDTLRVNGSPSAEAFQVDPNGTRFLVTRTTGVAFTLDAGAVEFLEINSAVGDDTITLNDLAGVAHLSNISVDGGANSDVLAVNGTGGPDTFDIDSVSVLRGGQPSVNYSNIEQLDAAGGGGDDTFNVMPSLATVYMIDGGLPSAPAAPGDMLNFFTPPGETATVLANKITTTGGYQDVFYMEIETGAVSGDILVTGTGLDDVLEVTASGPDSGSYVLTTNGVSGPAVNIFAVTSFTFDALGDDDRLIINNPVVGVFGPGGGIFYYGGAGNDDLVINGGTATTVTHTFTSVNDGAIEFDGALLTYTGLEPIEDSVAATDRFFVFGGAADVVVLADGTAGRSVLSSNSGETVDFLNPSGNLTISTGAGNDSVDATGSSFSVHLIGGDGNDTLRGGGGNDSLTGGLGSDSLVGGAGIDRLVESADVNFILSNTQLKGGLGTDSLNSIEQAHLIGGPSANRLDATSFNVGTVTLSGMAGNDTLIGGWGNDLLTGGSGADSIDGNHGFDVLREIGNVNFTLSGSQLTGLGTDTLSRIEGAHLTGGAGNNSINATDFLGRTTLEGLGGNDTLTGGHVQDSLVGGDGNDLLVGKLGDDTLIGGLGDDTLLGGSHADSLVGGDGNDKLDGQGGSYDTLIGGAGNDTLEGAEGHDALCGGDGDDFLNGKGGNDTILGGAGHDTIYGGAGNDLLLGGADNDLIRGHGGVDSGTGGGNGVPLSPGDNVDLENDLGFMFVFDAPWCDV